MKVFFSLLSLTLSLFAIAQTPAESSFYHGRRISVEGLNKAPANPAAENSTGQSGSGQNIDVVYHRTEWFINPNAAKAISGIVTTYFTTIGPNVSEISFDLNKNSFNNPALLVTYHGSPCFVSFPTTGNLNILTILLPVNLPSAGTLDSVSIQYAGSPPAISGSAEGFQKATTPAGDSYIYTLSESYEDRDWWPCKADMQDKIDSMDINVTTPWTGADTFWVASNGKLTDSVINNETRRFTFKNRYPMASYLVCLSVARYNRYYRGNVTIGSKQVPVVYNIFRGKTATQYDNILAKMDNINVVLQAFSQKFGDYPFAREKHGFYEGLGGAGGMEHQTFSAIASNALTDASTLAHELMHQWFGDKTSFSTWADLWLAEGFATYGEILAGELVPSTGINAAGKLASIKNSARSNTSTPVRITSFANSNQVWTNSNSNAVYNRGCMVLSMLRALSGDEKYFAACRAYLDSATGSGYKSANTDSLKNNFNKVLATDITPFFDDYVLGNGHPTYSINWQTGAVPGITVSIGSQVKSNGSSVAYFNGPVVLRLQGAAGEDTSIVFYDLTDGNFATGNLAIAGNGIGAPQPGNSLFIPASFKPVTVTFDPLSQTLASGTTNQVTLVNSSIKDFNVVQNGTANDATLVINNSTSSLISVERSGDSMAWISIGQMTLQSATSNEQTYFAKDLSPLTGDNYYRATYTDAVGARIYSRTVKIAGTPVNANERFLVITNPVNGDLQLRTPTAALNNSYVFTFYDASGKRVYQLRSNVASNTMLFPTAAWQSGMYVLKIVAGDGKINTLKFLIQ